MAHYVLCTGGRHPPDGVEEDVEVVLEFLHSFYGAGLRVMHGAAPGVDTMVNDVCERRGIKVKPYPAEWGTLGRAAGPARNRKMGSALASWLVEHTGEVIAFRGGRGTADMVSFAESLGLVVTHIPSYDPALDRN